MTIAETYARPQLVEPATAEDQAHQIAERFFKAIDTSRSTSESPVFVAYFMQNYPEHTETEKLLLRAVRDLYILPGSSCVSVPDVASRVILTSLASANQLVVSEQPEASARSYWVCAPDQLPLF